MLLHPCSLAPGAQRSNAAPNAKQQHLNPRGQAFGLTIVAPEQMCGWAGRCVGQLGLTPPAPSSSYSRCPKAMARTRALGMA